MSLIHRTKGWKGYGKQNYYYNEYIDEGVRIVKYAVNEFKSFDGKENNWHKVRKAVESWAKDDLKMPDWLRKKIER